MKVHLKIKRFNPETDSKPYWGEYDVDMEGTDRVLDALQDVKWTQDGTLTLRRSCAHGVCGSDAMRINGRNRLACKVLLQDEAKSGLVTVEPILGLKVLKDLIVDRSSFDRIIQSGGYISASTGQAQDGNAILIGKEQAARAMNASECIGCGACAAACPNGSAMLFTGAKVAHLARLPQGRPEAAKRVLSMIAQHDKEGFGMCSNVGACEAECPKSISLDTIATMNREYTSASFSAAPEKAMAEGV